MDTGRRVLAAIVTVGIGAALVAPSVAATPGTAESWSTLGVVRPLLVQPSGWGSPVAAEPSGEAYGWCSPKGVEVTSGSGPAILVSDSPVGEMLKDSHLALSGLPGNSRVVPTCDDVALDPSHPATVYAGFEASQGGSIPPVYNVALVTTNMGRSWRFVPPPRGYTLTDFAGFIERPGGVEVLFSRNYFFPLKPGHWATFVAATSSTGGESWTDVRLECPAGAPCVIFGPQAPQGACGMSEWQQSVLVGRLEELNGADIWRPAGSASTVSQCGSQQLVTTTSGDEFLIDRSRTSALRYTHDGTHWTTVSLPRIDGAPVGGRSTYLGQLMTLTASGALVVVAGSPLATAEHLEVLQPGSNAWCATTAKLPTATRGHPVAAIQSSETRLVVAFFTPIPTVRGRAVKALTIPLSMLRCQSRSQT